jgi:hypothetical protein
MMTTASQVTNRGNPINGTAHDFGAGQVVPSAALDPGIVFDAGEVDYQVFSCTMVQRKAWKAKWVKKAPKAPAFCEKVCTAGKKKMANCKYPQAVRDLNMPSFSLPNLKLGGKGALARRTVTYVGDGPAVFKAELILPTGYTGAVSAPTLTFTEAGQKASFNLTVTATGKAPRKPWAFGSLTWTSQGGRWKARSPIALKRV